MNVLVTFDIDGTLIESADGGFEHTDIMRRVAMEMCGLEDGITITELLGQSLSGTTDYWVTKKIIEKTVGLDYVNHEFICKFGKRECELYRGSNSIRALPGVIQLLTYLKNMDGVKITLCTGNFEDIAWKKLKSGALDHFFSGCHGGFGEIELRSNIIRKAIKDMETAYQIQFDRIIHIGDAIQDVMAAQDAGVIAVGLETGIHKQEDFPKPCYVLKNLEIGFQALINIIQGDNNAL